MVLNAEVYLIVMNAKFIFQETYLPQFSFSLERICFGADLSAKEPII
jgi:hypothetical protein